jgi:hypothetical protein
MLQSLGIFGLAECVESRIGMPLTWYLIEDLSEWIARQPDWIGLDWFGKMLEVSAESKWLTSCDRRTSIESMVHRLH